MRYKELEQQRMYRVAERGPKVGIEVVDIRGPKVGIDLMDFVRSYQFPLLEELLHAESTWEVQVTLLVIQACAWSVIIPWVAHNVVLPFLESKPWKQQWLELNLQKARNMGIEVPKEHALELCAQGIPILIQHGLGGSLCLISMLNIFSPDVNNALACHGALIEAGWELQDILKRFALRFFGGEEGKLRNPNSLMLFILIHHAMGLLMVLPMNMYFRDSWAYHEGAFLLQGAAFFGMMFQHYGFTINVKESHGLKQMKCCVMVTFIIMLYSRGPRYLYVVYHVLSTLYSAKAYKMFAGACFVSALMSMLNMLLLNDATIKLKKFWWAASSAQKKDHVLIRKSSSDFSASVAGLNGAIMPTILTSSQKNWAKLRGAVMSGRVGNNTNYEKDKDQ